MNFIDIVFTSILLWAAYKGLTKGFIIQLASLAALVLGIYGAMRFSHFTSKILIEKFSLSGKFLPIVSFAITFVIIVVIVHLTAKLTDKLAKAAALGLANRIAGLTFSVLKSAFIISVTIVILDSVNSKAQFLPEKQIEESILYKPLSKLAPWVFPYLKKGFENFNANNQLE